MLVRHFAARIAPGPLVAGRKRGRVRRGRPGSSAIQLAHALGAGAVFAVDLNPRKLALAVLLGATPINAASKDPVAAIQALTQGRGVDVALELVGLPFTMQQAVRSLAIKGRAALVGITPESFSVAPYPEVINKEAEIIGVSDHLAVELPGLIAFARERKLNLARAVTACVPLAAAAINHALDRLEQFGDEVRTVIQP